MSFPQPVNRVDVEANRVYLDDEDSAGLRRPRGRLGARLLPDEAQGLTGPARLKSLHLRHPAGAVAFAPGARGLHGRAGRRERRRPADQVSGGAVGVLLPSRLLLPRRASPGSS